MSSIKASFIGLILIFCGNLEASSCHNYFSQKPHPSFVQRFIETWNRIHFSKLRVSPKFDLELFEQEKSNIYSALADGNKISIKTPQQVLAALEAYESLSKNTRIISDLRNIESQRDLLLITLSNIFNRPRITNARLFEVMDIYYLYQNSQNYSFLKLFTEYNQHKNFRKIVRERWIAESQKLDFINGFSNLGILQKEHLSEKSFRYLKNAAKWIFTYSFAIWTTLTTGIPAMLPNISLFSLPPIQRNIMIHNGDIQSRSVLLTAKTQNFYNWVRKIAPYLFVSIMLYHLPDAPFSMVSKFNTPEQHSNIVVLDNLPSRENLEADLLNILITKYRTEKQEEPPQEVIESLQITISKMKLYEISEQVTQEQ